MVRSVHVPLLTLGVCVHMRMFSCCLGGLGAELSETYAYMQNGVTVET